MHRPRAAAAAQTLRSRFGEPPMAAVIAGSGLGALADALEGRTACSYKDIRGFPEMGVAGHLGQTAVGALQGRRVLILGGRSHYYQGVDDEEVLVLVRAAALWGCRILVVTNAAGGVNPEYRPGDLMLIADHLNLLFRSPLRGPNNDAWGRRFPDLCHAYDPDLRRRMREAARLEGIALREGVYAANLGPSFETPAEGRLLRLLGADAVGMSTVPEVLAARHMGLRVVALSYISNSLVHKPEGVATHQEVLDNSRRVVEPLTRLLRRFVAGLNGTTNGHE
ncbi:MAG: purine-nucleoside phosphorylase [Candidatus Sumerlaeota bacterium]|nr:purine-nucleoside phosphorylase [Candidatus Sumerlaeota bacterium]